MRPGSRRSAGDACRLSLAFLERIDEPPPAARRPPGPDAHVSSDSDNAQFIAEEDGRIIGHAGGWAPQAATGVTLIFAVYVTPARRGTGVLRQLVDVLAQWSRAMGRPRLELEVIVGNDRAVRAYQRIGFTDTGQRAPHPTIPVLTEMLMARPA